MTHDDINLVKRKWLRWGELISPSKPHIHLGGWTTTHFDINVGVHDAYVGVIFHGYI